MTKLPTICRLLAAVCSLTLVTGASAEEVEDSLDRLSALQRIQAVERKLETLSRIVEAQARVIAEQRQQMDALRTRIQTGNMPSGATAGSRHDALSKAEGCVPAASDIVSGPAKAALTRSSSSTPFFTSCDNSELASPPPPQEVAGWTSSHAYIKSSDGNFDIRFGGRAQFDFRAYQGSEAPPSSFFLRRARLEADGGLFKHYQYRVQADFADQSSLLVRDAYINIHYRPAFQVQAGQFKAPFSQEELQTSKYMALVERSSLNAIAPKRSPGFMVHGELFGGAVTYAAGAFNGKGILAANTGSTPELNLRLRLSPFKDNGLLNDFSFGGAYATGQQEDGRSVIGRTASRSVTFFPRVPVNGRTERANAEFAWFYSNASLKGEYDRSVEAREGLGPAGGDLPSVVAEGFLLQGTYLFTGEKKTGSAVTPRSLFLESPGATGGAWELAIRYEHFRLDDGSDSNRVEALTLGVNWWLTQFVRFQSNLILERFDDPLRTPRPRETSAWSYLSRLQVIF
ncbi:MAG: porin [Acidobacteriota bacterium]